MLWRRCCKVVGPDDDVERSLSWATMARSGLLRRSEFTGESPRRPGSGVGVAFCFSGVGGGIADLARLSHS